MTHTFRQYQSRLFLHASALCLAVAGMMILVASCAADTGNHVVNGKFEAVENGRISSWSTSGDVAPKAVSGVWRTVNCRFDSLDENEAVFFFCMHAGSRGSIWIDNVKSSQIPVNNGGFEDDTSNWGLTGTATSVIDATRASEGGKSLRVTHPGAATPMSAVTFRCPVTPKTEYSISVDVFVGDDFQGEARVLVFDGKTQSNCLVTNYGECVLSGLVEQREKCGRNVAVLSPTRSTPAEVSQSISLNSKMNLRASVEIIGKQFDGNARLLIEDTATGKKIREMKMPVVNDGWRTQEVTFPADSEKIRVRIIAEGTGSLWADNVRVSTPRIVPPLQKVTWLPSSENLDVPKDIQVRIDGPSGKAIEGALELLGKDLAKYGIACSKTKAKNAWLKVLIVPKWSIKDNGEEAYSISVNRKGVTIGARHESGAFYGIMTLLQLISEQDGRPVVMACDATDWPDMPMRGILGGDEEQAARWKMNTVVISTGYPNSPDEKQWMRDYLAKCEKLNLDPIPYIITFYSGILVEQTNPNLVCGVWVKDEKLVLNGEEPVNLANKYVIRTKLSDVELKSVDGSIKYELGKDYVVVDGDMAHPYDLPDPKPFAVKRTSSSSIPSGAAVVASYDYVSHYRSSNGRTDQHIAYCPAEPQARQIMKDWLEQFCREYKFSHILLAHCLAEFYPAEHQMASDSRIIKSGKSPVEWLADEIRFQDAACKVGNPDVHLVQWVGELNELSKAVSSSIPKDALVQIWGYDANWPELYGRQAYDYWTKLGFKTSFVAWFNLENVRGFAQLVKEARAKGSPCLGMIDSCWTSTIDPMGGVQETAIVSWKTP